MTAWKRDVLLPCLTVGYPPPNRKWLARGEEVSGMWRYRVTTEGSLTIRSIQAEDHGNYTCKVNNTYGDDSVTHNLVVLGNIFNPFNSSPALINPHKINIMKLRKMSRRIRITGPAATAHQ